MDVSPFDPMRVFVWGKTPTEAIKKAAGYFEPTFGVSRRELKARHTGLTQPSAYRDEAVTVNPFEQSQRVREDTPSLKRFVVTRK